MQEYAEYLFRSKCRYPLSSTKRYKILLDLVFEFKCKTILEIGVYTGRRAKEMIETAGIHHPAEDITYLGFDLFEQMDEATLKNELSKMPDKYFDIRQKLERTGARIFLFKGWSKDTLPEFISKKEDFPSVDLVFIDGGHSVEAITWDWTNVSKIMTNYTIVVFDDYYVDCPHLIEKFGCNEIIDGIDRNVFSVDILDTKDSFQNDWGDLNVCMVKVSYGNSQ